MIGRFINADVAEVLTAEHQNFIQYNLYAYCFNNPVNLFDENGEWPDWATKVLIGAAVIAAVAVVTVATGGAGTGPMVAAVNCIATGALQGAITGAVSGAVMGAGTSAISHRITTGSWNGAGKAALDGAATGFMTGAITGAITGAATSKYCFVAGTPVLTVFGCVVIENIEAGDKVWAGDPETGEVLLKEVVQTFVNETDELVHIHVHGEEIITTPEHPFYVPTKGWTGAVDLRAGDILVLRSGEYVIVELVQHEILESPVTVYNFEVEDFHTYYVSNSSILVHNMCEMNNKQATEAAKKLGYKKTTGNSSHGKAVFKNPKAPRSKRYITVDVDGHNGGVWKAASSIKNLGSRTTRSGTYDISLRRIGP